MKVLPSGFGLKRKAPLKEESAMEQAYRSWELIQKLDIKDVLDAGKVINLPFPGIDAWVTFLPDSPIVGVPDVQRIREYWNLIGRKEGIMLLGSKGVGKSVRLMIFACIHYATQPKSSRLLCIWNANMPLLSSLKRALVFTYALESNVVQEIDAIDSLEGLAGFISQREVVAKETFSILVDSAQATDHLSWHGQPQRDAEQRQERWNAILLVGAR